MATVEEVKEDEEEEKGEEPEGVWVMMGSICCFPSQLTPPDSTEKRNKGRQKLVLLEENTCIKIDCILIQKNISSEKQAHFL